MKELVQLKVRGKEQKIVTIPKYCKIKEGDLITIEKVEA